MSLVSALYAGVSGLTGNAQAMNIIGDNLANVNTVGYKSSKAVFSDVFSTVLNNGATNMQIGHGSKLQNTQQSFSQGAFSASNNALDLAIDGAGFFVVNPGNGNIFTRSGQFRINDAGKVQDSSRNTLQGFRISAGTTSSSLSDIDLAGVQSSPSASTNFTLGANLNAAATAGTTFTSPITLYNSVGTQVVLNVSFTKVAGSNSWRYVAAPSVGSVTSGASGSISFNTSGQLSAVNGGALSNLTIGIAYAGTPAANAQTLTWNLINSSGASNGKMTGFAAASNNNSFVQDGYTTGTLLGLAVDNRGVISGLFNNGQTQQLFQVGLANFLSPTGLTKKGNNLFAESTQSGQPVIGTATTGGFGSVLGSQLELSNVDLASEFVTMIQTQQAFQASAKIVTTANDMLSITTQLVR
ncbi:MAG: flagellar biosynthesis protein FlgE [Nitrospinae bacterium RIFCSPLOWO2_12_FULL_47_7]|nr:MAG: flagellar biosynthesis protein FlgE [Nitrospinae bacterium RIFCSPLOWO2_12_FULL_47_7]